MASPQELDALLAKAMNAHQAGRLVEAQKSYQSVIEAVPEHYPALHFLGLTYFQQGQPDRGVSLVQKALAIKPDYVEAHYNIATALQGLGRFEEAVTHYQRVLAIDPGNPDAQNNLGAILIELRRPDEALPHFERALASNPNSAQAHSNIGILLRDMQRHEDAIRHLGRSLEIDPSNPQVCCNLGATFLALERRDAALAAYDQALAFAANLAEAHLGRGHVLNALNRQEEAAAAYDRAVTLNPHVEWGQGYRLFTKQLNCDWSGFAADSAKLIADVRSGIPVATPFMLLVATASAEEQLQCARLEIRKGHPASKNPLWRGERFNHDRIRVAYLSADLREHAVARVMAGLFEQHDRSRFEVSAISFGADDGSAMRQRLVKAFDRFDDVKSKSDREIAALIREREIDIAVDLMGFTQGNRLGVLAMRPAPLQVSYLGYSATTGAEYIDYVLGDETIIPRDHERLYSEKIAYLPHSFMVSDRTRKVPDTPVSRQTAGLPEQGFVFCSFNNSYKYTPDMFDVWMRLLKAVDGSVLWLLEGTAASAGNLRREAAARGVAPERLVFASRVDPESHLARHRLADLFLDTLPYNAHTSTSDALWTGLPVLTCLGTTFAGRVAGSLVKAVGLSDLVATSIADYEALALKIARDPALLASIKARLAESRLTEPLFDTARSARDIESAFTMMVERQRNGLPPATFAVETRN